MNADQSQALLELRKNVDELNQLLTDVKGNPDLTMRAFEVVLALRCNANLVKSYVLDLLDEPIPA